MNVLDSEVKDRDHDQAKCGRKQRRHMYWRLPFSVHASAFLVVLVNLWRMVTVTNTR